MVTLIGQPSIYLHFTLISSTKEPIQMNPPPPTLHQLMAQAATAAAAAMAAGQLTPSPQIPIHFQPPQIPQFHPDLAPPPGNTVRFHPAWPTAENVSPASTIRPRTPQASLRDRLPTYPYPIPPVPIGDPLEGCDSEQVQLINENERVRIIRHSLQNISAYHHRPGNPNPPPLRILLP